LALLAFAARSWADDFEKWLQSELTVSVNKLVGNIQSNGAVIAAPSHANPNYFFHWVRDGALTMDVVVSLYRNTKDPTELGQYSSLLMAYLDFSLGNQVTPNRRSAPGRGLGEPKFCVTGAPFEGDWGRPQDDGPALRTLTFIRLANLFLNDPTRAQLVKTKLYDSTLPTNSVIKRDLEYVAHNWSNTCFDLWEEVEGHHFYTQMVQRRALLEGAKLARALSDDGAATFYQDQAGKLADEIAKYWIPDKGLIVVSRDQAGGNDKEGGFDTAVLLGVLHAAAPDDDFFAPIDDRVLATAAQLASKFQGLYDINQKARGTPGIALGRYPNDRYGGNDGTTEGNAWVLCTLALGELYSRAANRWEERGIAVTALNKKLFTFLNADKLGGLAPGPLTKDTQGFRDVIAALRSAADDQLRRVQFHAFADGSLSEQMNQHTGFMQSAPNLTWNYASVLTTLARRRPAVAALPAKEFQSLLAASRNRAGMPILTDAHVKRLLSAAKNGAPANPSVPGSAAELRLRVAELEAQVKALLEEVRKLRAAKAATFPK
jgi:glucoamylase